MAANDRLDWIDKLNAFEAAHHIPEMGEGQSFISWRLTRRSETNQ